MLGRLYTIIFILTILISLWYQRVYLNKSAVEFKDQLMAEHAVLPTITGSNYNSLTFENGVQKSSFSGKNLVYFSNKHFEATENLVYSEVTSSSQNISQLSLNSDYIVIKTSKAIGEVISSQPNNTQTLISKNTLKYAILPNIVNFNINNNIGKTSHVYIDAIKKTLETEKPIESRGPSGDIKGIGFFYAMNSGEFILKSNVEGMLVPTRIPKD